MSNQTTEVKPTTSQPEQKGFNAGSCIENRDMEALQSRILVGIVDAFAKCEDNVNGIIDENYSYELLTKDYIVFKKKIYDIFNKNYQRYTCKEEFTEEHFQGLENLIYLTFGDFEKAHGIPDIDPDEWEEDKPETKAKTSIEKTGSLKDDYLELKGKFLLFDYQEQDLKKKLSEKYKITFPVDGDEEDIIEDYIGALQSEISLALSEFEEARGLKGTPEDFDKAEAKKQAPQATKPMS